MPRYVKCHRHLIKGKIPMDIFSAMIIDIYIYIWVNICTRICVLIERQSLEHLDCGHLRHSWHWPKWPDRY